MTDQDTITHRGWQITALSSGRTGIVSPYGVLTRTADYPLWSVKTHAKDWIDAVIRKHYPERSTGDRYGPPLSHRPKPGQPHGLRFHRCRPPKEEEI